MTKHLGLESLSTAQQRDPWLARALSLVLLASANRSAHGDTQEKPSGGEQAWEFEEDRNRMLPKAAGETPSCRKLSSSATWRVPLPFSLWSPQSF